jgi:hypothetical protein
VRYDRIITDLLDSARARDPRFEWVVVDDWLARLLDEQQLLIPERAVMHHSLLRLRDDA